MNCKNCGHPIIKTKTYNGWEHIWNDEIHLSCIYTGDEDQYEECECNKPEPKEAKKEALK